MTRKCWEIIQLMLGLGYCSVMMSEYAWEYLKIVQGCQVLWNLSTWSLDCASVSSILKISDILWSHSAIEGTRGEFQWIGIRDLAAFSKCFERECLYFFKAEFDICSKQHAALSMSLVSVIRMIVSLTFFQNGVSDEQCHQMFIREPVSLRHVQHLSVTWGFHLCSFVSVKYQCVNNLNTISCALALIEHVCVRMHAFFHCLAVITIYKASNHLLLSLSSPGFLAPCNHAYTADVALKNSSPVRHTDSNSTKGLEKSPTQDLP